MPDIVTTHEPHVGRLTPTIKVPFDDYIAQRPTTLKINNELPHYLLLPEVYRVLDAALLDHHRLLLSLLWYTGARINEALALTVKDIAFDGGPHVILKNSKSQSGTGKRKKRANPSFRAVPLVSASFCLKLQQHIKTHHLRQRDPLFTNSRQAVNGYLERITQGLRLPIKVSPHTFRHSFAVNLLLHGQDIKTVKTLLGHRRLETTEVYTNVIGTDLAHLLQGVSFDRTLIQS